MGKIKEILKQQGAEIEKHPSYDELASFVDGKLVTEERQVIAEHLSHCEDCYETVQQTMANLETEKQAVKEKLTPLKGKRFFALAVSIAFVALIGSGLWFKGGLYHGSSDVFTATIVLDDELRDVILEDGKLVWTGERADRFASILVDRGVEVATDIDSVTLTAMYDPFSNKGLEKKTEVLVLKMSGGKIVVEIKQKE